MNFLQAYCHRVKASSGRQMSVVPLRVLQVLTDAEFPDESCYSDQHNCVN